MQMRSREQGQYEGKERYEGYLADVIEELARRLAFTYELYEPAEATNIRDKFTSGKPFSSLVHELINGVSIKHLRLLNYYLNIVT